MPQSQSTRLATSWGSPTNAPEETAVFGHVHGDVVIVHAFSVRVDAGKATRATVVVIGLVHTRTRAAISTVISAEFVVVVRVAVAVA